MEQGRRVLMREEGTEPLSPPAVYNKMEETGDLGGNLAAAFGPASCSFS